MNRLALTRPRGSQLAALAAGACIALFGIPAPAADGSGLHLAIDGISLSLDEAHAVSGVGANDVDALGLRVRAGLEFGGWSPHRVTHHRSRGHTKRRGSRPGRGLDRRPRLGVEMHAALAHGEQAGTVERVDTSLLGGYLTGRVPLGRYLSVKGLVGLTSLAIDDETRAVSRTDRLNGIGFGVGLEAAVGRYTDLTVDWMRYLADVNDNDTGAADGIERVSALAIGLKLRF